MNPFIPDTLPLSSINWEAHVSNIGKAQAALACYEGIAAVAFDDSGN